MWTLIRSSETNKYILGTLKDGFDFILLTLERPWLENWNNVSCIPCGTYKCKRVNSPKFGWTFEITGIEGRDHVLFHNGCFDHNTHGCVLLGTDSGIINGEFGIKNSKQAFLEFMAKLDGVNEFDLFITEA